MSHYITQKFISEFRRGKWWRHARWRISKFIAVALLAGLTALVGCTSGASNDNFTARTTSQSSTSSSASSATGNVAVTFQVAQNAGASVESRAVSASTATVVGYLLNDNGTDAVTPVTAQRSGNSSSITVSFSNVPAGNYTFFAALFDSTGKLIGYADFSLTVAAGQTVGQTVTTSATLSSITVAPSTATIAPTGTQAFRVTASFSDGSSAVLTGQQVAWSSSNAAVATVNASGVATGQSIGNATITASMSTKTSTAALTVSGTAPSPSPSSSPSPSPSPTPTPAVWPMFQHDLMHSGLSAFSTSAGTGALSWRYNTGGFGGSTLPASPVIGLDGTIYIGTGFDDVLFALNPNGTMKWSYTGPASQTAAVDPNGNVYFGGDSSLYALNSSGSFRWSYATGQPILSAPTLGTDGTIYMGSNDNKLYAIDPSGSFKWSYTTSGAVQSSPALDASGNVYVGSNDDNLYAVNSNGVFRWMYTTGNEVISSPSIAGGTIYFGSLDNVLYALNVNGSFKWGYATSDGISSSPAVAGNGTVYVGSDDSNLYAINPNGSFQWAYPASGPVASSPAIGADGTIFVGDGRVFRPSGFLILAINANGTNKWTYATGDMVNSSPAIGSDATIYIGSQDDFLYAIH